MAQAKSTQSNNGAKRRRKILLAVSTIFILWAGYTLINQSNQKDTMQERLMSLEGNRNVLSEQVEELQTQVERLNDPEYMEQLATKEQGMVKEGEQQIFSEHP